MSVPEGYNGYLHFSCAGSAAAVRTQGRLGAAYSVDDEQYRLNSARRILVVDDERMIVRLMQVNLDRAGFKVDTASSVEEAQIRMEANLPDVVVTDAMMPELDGFELLK